MQAHTQLRIFLLHYIYENLSYGRQTKKNDKVFLNLTPENWGSLPLSLIFYYKIFII